MLKLKKYLIPFLILITTIFVFSPAINGPILDWDDTEQITSNLDIQTISLKNTFKIFTSFYTAMYQPLASLSYSINWLISTEQTWSYHATNVLIHLINIFLVYLLTKKLFGKKNIALLTSAFFTVWPIQVEAVAWLSTRSTLLSASFILASLVFYLRSSSSTNSTVITSLPTCTQAGSTPQSNLVKNSSHCEAVIQRSNLVNKFINFLKYNKNLIFCFLFFILALLTKSIAVITPVLLLTIDYYQNKKINFKNLISKLPFFIPAIIIGIIAIIARESAGAGKYLVYSLFNKIIIILYTIAKQAYITFLPINLYTYYPHPVNFNDQPFWWTYLAASLPILFAFLIWRYRKNKLLIFFVFWFFFNVILSLQLSPYITIAGADRYSYLAVLAILWPLSFLLTKTHYLWKIITAGLFLICTLYSWQLSFTWANEVDLWDNVLANEPDCHIAYLSRGTAHLKNNDITNAYLDIDLATALAPNYIEARNRKGYFLMTVFHDNKKAAVEFSKAAQLDFKNPIYHYNLGLTLYNLQIFQGSISEMEIAINLEKKQKNNSEFIANALYSQAVALQALKKPAESLAKIDECLLLNQQKQEAIALKNILTKKKVR